MWHGQMIKTCNLKKFIDNTPMRPKFLPLDCITGMVILPRPPALAPGLALQQIDLKVLIIKCPRQLPREDTSH